MKNLVSVAIMIGMNLVTAEAAENKSGIEAFKKIYEEIGAIEIEYYSISMTTDKRSLKSAIAQTDCADPKKFKRTTSKKLSEEIYQIALNGLERAIGLERSFLEVRDSLLAARKLLTEELKDSNLRICTFQSSPAYSDGHTEHFVTVDDKLNLGVSVGFPD
jgi:hypothetical protein